MAFEEQIDQYKNLDGWKRFLIVAVLGAAFPIYQFIEEGESIAQQLQQAEKQQSTARARFLKSQKNKKKIPELQKEKEEKAEKIEATNRVLPHDFNVDEILHQTAMAARSTGVKLTSFTPQEAEEKGRYREYPVSLELEGNFSQTAVFMDRLAHMDNLIHLRGIGMNRQRVGRRAVPGQESETRQKVSLSTKMNMVVFIRNKTPEVK